MRNYPKRHADFLYKEIYGRNIDWKHPRDLNEFINYQAFYTDTSIWTQLADKYKVREYVRQKGCEEILIPLLGKWDNAEEIDFSTLPNQFILKSNHGSGDVIIVKDKQSTNLRTISEKINFALHQKFGLESAEPHYLKIKPCIIAEELLKPSNGKLVDYKIWCFNGKPHCIFTGSNRDVEKHTVDFNVFDLDWNRMDHYMAEPFKNNVPVQKPKNLPAMLDYAQKLSQGFSQVRVDFYEVNDKIYFGEMTFTSQCGRMNYFTQEFLKEMLKQIK